jgi:hypothetical protein
MRSSHKVLLEANSVFSNAASVAVRDETRLPEN